MIKLLTATFGTLSISAESSGTLHPNKLKFEGVLLRLDTPSDKPPNGARGHRILVPKAVAQKKLKTLINMGVNLSYDKDSHAPQRKIGVIKKAWIKGNELWISGIIWKKDFPDAEKDLKSEKLGMSFEGSEVQIENQDAHIWKVKDLVFTGAALLLKTAAAYTKTEALAASAMIAELVGIDNGGVRMAKVNKVTAEDPLVAAVSAAIQKGFQGVTSALEAQTAAITTLHASQESSQAELLEVLAARHKREDDDDEDEDEDDEEEASAVKAKGKKSKKDEDDDDDDDDDDDEDEEDDEQASAVKAKGKKSKKDEDDDDDDDDDEEASAVKASDADDEDELEDLDKNVPDNMDPGKLNKSATKEKGKKTTVTTHASASLRKLVTKLMAENMELRNSIRKVKKQNAKISAQAEKAAARINRKSITASATPKQNAGQPSTLFKGLLNKYDMAAGDSSKKTMQEFTAMLDAEGITDPATRIALKLDAERNGTVYTTEDMLQASK